MRPEKTGAPGLAESPRPCCESRSADAAPDVPLFVPESILDCPLQVTQRINRLKQEIDGLRLKIEGLALLGDMLGERLDETAALPHRCKQSAGEVCNDAACLLVKGAVGLEHAFDRIAHRIDALQKAVETARRIASSPVSPRED